MIVDLQKFKEAKEPHSHGLARCLDCKHEWHAVAHIDVTWMECPSCTLVRGRFVGQFAVPGPHWICSCGNDLFHATQEGVYCPNCGKWHIIYEKSS